MDVGTLLIAIMVSIVAPVLLSYLNGRERHKEKKQEYERQDLVAERVAEAARQAEQAAKLLLEDNKRVATLAATTSRTTLLRLQHIADQGAEIHRLVNSNLTQAQQRELSATITMHETMLEVIDLKRKAGFPPSEKALTVVNEVQGRIANMERELKYKKDAEEEHNA